MLKEEALREEIEHWHRRYLDTLREFPNVYGVVSFIAQDMTKGPDQDLRDRAVNYFFGLCSSTTDQFNRIGNLAETIAETIAFDPELLKPSDD